MRKREMIKGIEKWLIRLIIIQFIFLFLAQLLMRDDRISPYLNKTIQSEGVVKQSSQTAVETMEQVKSIWYDRRNK